FAMELTAPPPASVIWPPTKSAGPLPSSKAAMLSTGLFVPAPSGCQLAPSHAATWATGAPAADVDPPPPTGRGPPPPPPSKAASASTNPSSAQPPRDDQPAPLQRTTPKAGWPAIVVLALA